MVLVFVPLISVAGMKIWVLDVRDRFAGTNTSVIAVLMFLASQKHVTKQFIALIKNEGRIPLRLLSIIRTKLKHHKKTLLLFVCCLCCLGINLLFIICCFSVLNYGCSLQMGI